MQADDSLKVIFKAASQESKLDLLLAEMDLPRTGAARLSEYPKGVPWEKRKLSIPAQAGY